MPDVALSQDRCLPVIPTPRELQSELPRSARAATRVLRTRAEIRALLHGHDVKRLLVVVGPCSLHDPDSAREYASRLAKLAGSTRDQLVIVMRTYFEKPRTCMGWKGFLNDPQLDGSCRMDVGLRSARRLLLEINELGLACGSEVLDPLSPHYLSDLLSWSAIGARTVESQTHRELASVLPMPVGLKNPTSGDLGIALNALASVREAHAFLTISTTGEPVVAQGRGNPDSCLVLRGGARGTNYDGHSVGVAAQSLAQRGLLPRLLIDCSHDNSLQDHVRQIRVVRDVLRQVRAGGSTIMGLLIESHLRSGRQAFRNGAPLEYGVSITDGCMGWDDTERLLLETAEAVER